jgi:hypothetical protein
MSWALASPAAKRRVPILLAVLLTVFGFVYCLLSVTTQCPLRIAHAEPIHSTTSVLADALTLRVGNYSATLPDINPLKSILSVTSATAASLLFAVVAFLYNLRVRIYESYSRVYVTYVQSMTRFERKLHEELKPFQPHTRWKEERGSWAKPTFNGRRAHMQVCRKAPGNFSTLGLSTQN